MYNFSFISKQNERFDFGADGCAADISIGQGTVAQLNVSELSETGVNINSVTHGGKTFEVSGSIYATEAKTITDKKNELQFLCYSGAEGQLEIVTGGKTRVIDVVVESSPTFEEEKTNGRFTMSFFATVPFFKVLPAKKIVNDTQFKISESATNKVPLRIDLKLNGDTDTLIVALNFVDASPNTPQRYLIFNGVFKSKDKIKISSSLNSEFKAEVWRGIAYQDGLNIVPWVEDESDLFYIPTHEKCRIKVSTLPTDVLESVEISYNELEASVYEY